MSKETKTLLSLAALVLLFVYLNGTSVIVPPAPGKATILVAYEEAKATPAFADLIVDFQNGPAGKPFKDRGHTIYCLDNDTADLSGQLAKPLRPFAPYDDSKPEVIVSAGDQLRYRLPLTYDITAEALASLLTGKGL